MRMKNVIALCATVAMIFMLTGLFSTALADSSKMTLSVKHEITTTGLPLVGPIVVYNTQSFNGNMVCRSTRTSKITMNDSVYSDVTVTTVTDLVNEKQIYINPKTELYALHGFNSQSFPVIDEAKDAKRPQMTINKTGQTKTIDGKKCTEITFKLDLSSKTGVGDAKIKHYFEGSMWVSKDITNYQVYNDYNNHAMDYFRGTQYISGGFFDILKRLDVDDYNLSRLVKAVEGVPIEATFIAQLPSGSGGNVFETKIKLVEFTVKAFAKGHFGPPKAFKEVPISEYKSF